MEDNDKKQLLNLLKTSKGQIEGIIKMVDDDRYCVEISKQILAVQALLRKSNLRILDQHIKHCVKQAFEEGYGNEKVDEVMEILEKYAR